MFLLSMRANTSPSVSPSPLQQHQQRHSYWEEFSTNSKCLSQQQLPSPEGCWQECAVRNISLPPAVNLIMYCGKVILMIVCNTALEICGFGYVSFSSSEIPGFEPPGGVVSGNVFPNKPVTRRCLPPRGDREAVRSSLGISPKACLRTGSDILSKMGSSKSYPQPQILCKSPVRQQWGQRKSSKL